MSDIMERLHSEIRDREANAEFYDPDVTDMLKEVADEIERLRDALGSIVQWSEAYPLDIFHEPSKEEFQKAHEVLTANGMTLDAISTSAMRHVVQGVGKIAIDALKETQ